eukprot:6379795-Amphidinium_carterae.2
MTTNSHVESLLRNLLGYRACHGPVVEAQDVWVLDLVCRMVCIMQPMVSQHQMVSTSVYGMWHWHYDNISPEVIKNKTR